MGGPSSYRHQSQELVIPYTFLFLSNHCMTMTPRPFPQALRIGCDIIKISRITEVISKSNTSGGYYAFLRKLLTARERDHFKAKFQNLDLDGPKTPLRVSHFLSGRWAAKEACIKAVKPRKLTFKEVEIWPDSHSEMYAIILHEAASQDTPPANQEGVDSTEQSGKDISAETFDERNVNLKPEMPSHNDIKGQIARVSISHGDEYAIATALAVPEPQSGDVGGEAAARAPGGG